VLLAFVVSSVLSVARLRDSAHVLAYNQFDRLTGKNGLAFVDIARRVAAETPRIDTLYTALPSARGSFAPDGVTHVISRPTDNGIDLFIQTDGQTGDESLRQLTIAHHFPHHGDTGDNRRSNTAPVWSADGRWIAFISSDTSGTQDVFIIRPDGTALREVAPNVGNRLPLALRWVEVTPRHFPGLVVMGILGGLLLITFRFK